MLAVSESRLAVAKLPEEFIERGSRVCVCERERDRQTDRQEMKRERERERE